MMLHAIHYSDSSTSTFTQDISTPAQVPHTGSRTCETLMKEVLGGLEHELRTRTKSSWATSFCVILMLSICIEAIQIEAYEYIAIGKANASEAVIETCLSLESGPFKYCTEL